MTDDLSTSLAAVLAEHADSTDRSARDGCYCGFEGHWLAHATEVLTARVSVLLTAAKHDAWNEAVELARAKFAAEDSVDWCRQANASSVSLPLAMEYLDDTEDDNPYSRVYTAKEADR